MIAQSSLILEEGSSCSWDEAIKKDSLEVAVDLTCHWSMWYSHLQWLWGSEVQWGTLWHNTRPMHILQRWYLRVIHVKKSTPLGGGGCLLGKRASSSGHTAPYGLDVGGTSGVGMLSVSATLGVDDGPLSAKAGAVGSFPAPSNTFANIAKRSPCLNMDLGQSWRSHTAPHSKLGDTPECTAHLCMTIASASISSLPSSLRSSTYP